MTPRSIDLWGVQPVTDDKGGLIGYIVKKGQGPTQIAEDLNKIYQLNLDWTDIVNFSLNNVRYFSHIEQNRMDANNNAYRHLNMNPGDYIDLSFLQVSGIPLDLSNSKTPGEDFVRLLGEYASGLIGEQGMLASELFDFGKLPDVSYFGNMDVSGGGMKKSILKPYLFGFELDEVRLVVLADLNKEPTSGVKFGSRLTTDGLYYFVGLSSFSYTSYDVGVDPTMTIAVLQFRGKNAQELYGRIKKYIMGEISFDEIENIE